MITLAEISAAYKNATDNERKEFIQLILPELKTIFQKDIIDTLDERLFEIDNDLVKLEEKIETIEVRHRDKPVVKFKRDTTTGRRADGLITALRASGKDHLTHKEIKKILTGDQMEEDKIDINCKNPRKTIIDTLKEAAMICTDVFLDQKSYGRKEWRLVLKRNQS